MSTQKSIVEVIDSIPFLPRTDVMDVSATTGTKAQDQLYCDDKLDNLQELMKQAQVIYDQYKEEISKIEYDNDKLKDIAPSVYGFTYPFIKKSKVEAADIMEEMQKVSDATLITYIKSKISLVGLKFFGTATAVHVKFCTALKSIEDAAAKIKKEAQTDEVKYKIENNSIVKSELDNYPFKKYLYELELYIILPGGQKFNVEQYINEFLYTRLFDDTNLPIYSVLLKVPETILNLIKLHNEKIKWFVTIRCRDKNLGRDDFRFRFPQVIIKDAQLIPIDPKYSVETTDAEREDSSTPIHPLKIDLVPHKDTVINSKVKPLIFNNVRMIDVITALAADARDEYKRRGEDTSKDVRVAIAPPDNTAYYDQIIVQPGSFTKCLNNLQTRYGVYNTGIRVSFDVISSTTDNGDQQNAVQITVNGKGDTAPVKDALNEVMVELVTPKNVKNPAYDSGAFIDEESNTTLIRSFLPYVVTRVNSDALINGESIKVLNSSQEDHSISNCDTTSSETTKEAVYWSKYDNPYAITQLQDSIREKQLTVHAEFADLNILLFNNNMAYSLKFFGIDDKTYSGDYRMSELRFYYRGGTGVGDIKSVETKAIITFTNIPPLRVNGADVARDTYSEKLVKSAATKSTAGDAYEKIHFDAPINLPNATTNPSNGGSSGGKANISTSRPASSSAPYATNFAGRKDYYGHPIPSKIPDNYAMSPRVMFKHVYDCKDGANRQKATGLAQQFQYFINAQRFSKEVLEPCIGMFGTLGTGGKLNSWYRYGIPSGGSKTSQHLIALAVDSTWGNSAGNTLCEKFLKIFQSGLDFDQLMLEGNGTEWRWIHIGKQMNGANRRQVKLTFNATKGPFKTINMSKVKSASDLYFAVANKVCY